MGNDFEITPASPPRSDRGSASSSPGASANASADASAAVFAPTTASVPWNTDRLTQDDSDNRTRNAPRGRRNPGDDVDIPGNKFAFTPNQLHKLLNDRTASGLRAIGGLAGLCAGLRTNPRAGLSVDETELDGAVTLSEALNAARSGRPVNPDVTRPTVPRRATTTIGKPTIVPYADRRHVFGENRLPKPKQISIWALIWRALNDKLMFLLAASAIVSLALGISQVVLWGTRNMGAKTTWVESATIIAAIVATVMATAANDYQKNYKFQKLNQRREERSMTAIRSGKSCRISVFDVVVGDLLRVAAGDVLAADGVLVEAFSIQCDESHLSGESEVVRKVRADDYHSDSPSDPFVFSGAIMSQGVGTYIVTAVGTNSTSGRTAMSLRTEVEVTPLQQRLGYLAKYIIILGSLVGGIYFLALFIRWLVQIAQPSYTGGARQKGEAFLDIFMLAVTVVIIGVPEGLSLAVAAALAFAATRMLRDRNLVRLLRSCEVMGSATTICSDKTGTLTRNEMSVVSGVIGCDEIFGPGNTVVSPPVSCTLNDESDIASIESFVPAASLVGELAHDVKSLLKTSIVLNSTATEQDDSGTSQFVGSGTETALLKFAREQFAIGPVAEERANVQIVAILPFDADRKYMAVVQKIGSRYRLLVKGASEIVMANCVSTLENTKKHFNPREELITTALTPEKREELALMTRGYARRLLRPIALAYRDLESWPPVAALGAADDPNDDYANFEQVFRHQMTLVALLAIRDPLRPEVIESIRQCQRAGVFVRMLTGDNLITAEATALESGIYTSGGVAMDGPTFRRLNQDQIDAVVPRLQVLARSNADDKAKLVMTLRRLGETVAVTGDGTNDAFALKAADVGFSMGKSGTEVAKEASSIVLMDDNFASIIKALAWGRAVTESVKKYCQFQFTLNITAAIITIISTLIGDVNTAVFTVIQLLWLNLVMDILTGLLFSTDFPRPYLLRRPPEPRNTPLISVTMWKMIMVQAVYQLVVVFTLNYVGSRFWPNSSPKQVQTVVFNAYMFTQLFNQINCRRVDDRLDVFEGLIDNPWFLGVQAITFMGQIIIVFKGGAAFETEPLTGTQWGWSILFGILVIPVGAAARFMPNWWFETAGRLLKPLVWPCIALLDWVRDRKLDRARRKEVNRQRQRKRAETKTQDITHLEEAPQGEQHTGRRDWVKRMLGDRRGTASPMSKPSQAVPLTALPSRNDSTFSAPLFQTEQGSGPQPLDLLAAIEASKYNILEGSLPGLHVHPETQKDDPVLMLPPTIEEVLQGKLEKEKQRVVPPSQNWEVMRYVAVDRSRRRRSLFHRSRT